MISILLYLFKICAKTTIVYAAYHFNTTTMSEKKTYIVKVHNLTRQIPRGRVTNYGAIADYLALGSARMVGWALSQIPLLNDDIPAHRVLNRKGELSGRNNFPTPDTMKYRLESEGITVTNWKVENYDSLYWHPEELEPDEHGE